MKLNRDFYDRDTLVVAKELLGKKLVHKVNNVSYKVIISEVEAYVGMTDKACHTYGGVRTPRTEVMYGPPGYSYVYLIYGMYHCFNVVTESVDSPCAVLIRGGIAIHPDRISMNRYHKPLQSISPYQKKHMTNGPGKLCKGLLISKEQNGLDLTNSQLQIEKGIDITPSAIQLGKRINIDYAQEAKDFYGDFI